MMTHRLLPLLSAVAALTLIASGAQAQFNPYQSTASAPPFVSLGWGAPPTTITPYGVQSYGPSMPYANPYGYYGNGYYAYPQTAPYGNYGYDNSYYAPNGSSYYPPNGGDYAPANGYYAPNGTYYPAYGPNGYVAPNGYAVPNGYNPAYAPAAPAPAVLPRTSDSIEAQRQQAGWISLGWAGDQNTVSQITFSLLDKNHKVLKHQTITGPPTQVRMLKAPGTAYYQVTVHYLNGATNTVTSPIW
jgi:hypothetical protein